MKAQRLAILGTLSICLLVNALPSALSSNLPTETYEWGPPVDGLQMSISVAESPNATVPKFEIRFRNVGNRDFIE